MSKIPKELLGEWTESAVTLEAKRIAHEAVNEIISALQGAYVPFEPNKTQEMMTGLQGSLDAWYDFIDILAGDWDKFETEEEENGQP